MLLDVLHILARFRIVLASASPRRIEIMRQIGLEAVEVIPSTFSENLPKEGRTAASYAIATATCKAEEVWGRLHGGDSAAAAVGSGGASSTTGAAPGATMDRRPVLLVSADTVVEVPGTGLLEKPKDTEDAVRMLRALSGAQHSVHTGVVVMVTSRGAAVASGGGAASPGQPHTRQFSASTAVTFAPLPDSLIAAYVATGEPMDKAAALAAVLREVALEYEQAASS